MRTLILSIGQGLSYVGIFLAPIRDGFVRWIALPIYRIVFFAQLRIRKTVASTRGLIFLLFTSRYTLHILLSAFALPIAFTQLRPASANADVGQRSILYALVTNGQSSITEETSVSTAPLASTYLDETIAARANIDFDYDTSDLDITTDHGIAGTIALRPQPSSLFSNDTESQPAEEPAAIATVTPSTPEANQNEITTYTIKSGDTIARIARLNGISQNTIMWANDLTASSRLKPGGTLKILPVSGVLHTIKKGETFSTVAKKYGIDLSSLQKGNPSVQTLATGKALIIPGGKPIQAPTVAVATPSPSAPSTSAPTTKTPKITSSKNVRPDVPIARIKNKAFDIYQELASTNEDTRDKPVDEVVSEVKSVTKFVWPTARHVVNQYYGWAHTGIDIDGDYTDPIYAAADGTVSEAGWNSGGYGLQVVIEHAGSLKTRYAHASKLFVKAGEEVKRGEVIGYVGTTGRSTGTHLHFEVYRNGKRGNPLTYIK